MDAALLDLLETRSPALAAGLEAAILAHDAPHYREAPPGVLRARCERLVGAFLEAVRQGGPQAFERYVRGIVEERLAEGFALREVQQALSALEAQVWPLVAGQGGETDAVVRRLALVSGVAGRGKDELARAFLEHKERAEARAASLQHRLDALFAGTEPPPQG